MGAASKVQAVFAWKLVGDIIVLTDKGTGAKNALDDLPAVVSEVADIYWECPLEQRRVILRDHAGKWHLLKTEGNQFKTFRLLWGVEQEREAMAEAYSDLMVAARVAARHASGA